MAVSGGSVGDIKQVSAGAVIRDSRAEPAGPGRLEESPRRTRLPRLPRQTGVQRRVGCRVAESGVGPQSAGVFLQALPFCYGSRR
jgi:hypothetical protein